MFRVAGWNPQLPPLNDSPARFKRPLMWGFPTIYSYFEKGCRKKCTRQSWKVLWVVLSSLFFKEIWKDKLCLRMLKESNKSRFHSYSVRNSVLIISHIAFRDCREHNFSDNLSRKSCICITPFVSLMRQLCITAALKGHHLKGVYSPQDLYFPLTTLLAHPRWDLYLWNVSPQW